MILNTRNIDMNLVLESMGMPEAVREITDIAYGKLENIEHKIKTGRKMFDIIISKNETRQAFFNKLLIIIDIVAEDEDISRYIPIINGWDDVNKTYNIVKIEIKTTKENSLDIKELIGHELLHAYTDYKQKLNTDKGFNERNPNYITFNTEELNKIRNKFNGNIVLNKLIYYIYYLMQIEVNANVLQLYYQLEKLKKNKNYKTSAEELYAIKHGSFEDLDNYLIYSIINNNSEYYVNSLTKNELDLFGEYIKHTAINSLYSTDDKAFKKNVISFLMNKSTNVMKKMKKIVAEYINYNKLINEANESCPTKRRMLELIKTLEPK